MKIMKYVPNTLSITRLILASSLLVLWIVLPAESAFVMSPLFLVIYTIAGITDMIDGSIARKYGVASPLGANLDGAADYVFVGISIFLLVPYFLGIGISPVLIAIVVGGILVLKPLGMVVGYIRYGQLMMMHTYASKIAALSAFLFPLVYTTGVLPINIILTMLTIWVYFYLLEEIAINIAMPEPRRDISGIRGALRIRRELKSGQGE